MEYIYIPHAHLFLRTLTLHQLLSFGDHFDPLSFLKMKCSFVHFKLAITDRVG